MNKRPELLKIAGVSMSYEGKVYYKSHIFLITDKNTVCIQNIDIFKGLQWLPFPFDLFCDLLSNPLSNWMYQDKDL